MNDLFHQMFFSWWVVRWLQGYKWRNKLKRNEYHKANVKLWTLNIYFRPLATWLEKKIGVSLKATKAQIMSIFSDHIFIEIALVGSHGNGLGNKDQGLWQILSLRPSAVLSLPVLRAVLFEHGMVSVTDIRSVCMFTSRWGPKRACALLGSCSGGYVGKRVELFKCKWC